MLSEISTITNRKDSKDNLKEFPTWKGMIEFQWTFHQTTPPETFYVKDLHRDYTETMYHILWHCLCCPFGRNHMRTYFLFWTPAQLTYFYNHCTSSCYHCRFFFRLLCWMKVCETPTSIRGVEKFRKLILTFGTIFLQLSKVRKLFWLPME